MKTDGHITPTRTVVGANTRNYPFIEVYVLVEFDPGERYFAREELKVTEDRFCPTHHHQRALALDAISRIFKVFSQDARSIGTQEEMKDNG